MSEPTLTRNDEASRYEIHVGDALAGFIEVERSPGRVNFTHTEVDPAFQGGGIAGKLAAFALADAAGSGDTLIPTCPYIERYLRKNEIPGAKVEWPERPED